MGMTRQEAIAHLENMKWLKGYDNTKVGGVPLTDIIDNIIALLKAQEPRVMTLEEVQSYIDTSRIIREPVYVESRAGFGFWYLGDVDDDLYDETSFEFYATKESYGIYWRCWTSKPTDEQRKEVPF